VIAGGVLNVFSIMQPISPYGKITYGTERRAIVLGRYRVVETYHAAGTRLTRHDHEEPSLNIVIRGGFSERVGRRTVVNRRGTLVVKPAGAHHANEYASVRTLSVLVHVSTEASAGLGEIARAFGEVRALESARALSLGRLLFALLRSENDALADAEVMLQELLTDLSGVSPLSASGAGAPPWLRRIRDEIVDRATQRVSIGALAENEGVSLCEVAKGFRRAYGVTATQIVRAARVARATQLLADPAYSLSTVALASGFADQAHFTRAFKKETALTPGQFRKRELRVPR
jgi:AraC family transcriptional regulator